MNIFHDALYLALAETILDHGVKRGDRTGTGTLSVFSRQLRFNLSDGSFPLLSAKQTPLRVVLEELFWFLRGETNIRPLLLKNVHIWSEWPYKLYLKRQGKLNSDLSDQEWSEGLKEFETLIVNDEGFAKEHGELGPVYGSQWRSWETQNGKRIDQIAQLVESLKRSPDSRAHIVSAWNPAEYQWLRANSLPPCHVMFQCYVVNGKLSLDLTQRSCDYFLGVPFNIASYSALLLMLAHVTGLEPGEFVWNGKDVHIYLNHIEQTKEMLARPIRPAPRIKINRTVQFLEDFTFEDFVLEGYNPHPRIKAPVAV